MPDLLAGHIYPGCGFTLLGFSWSLTATVRYIRAENQQQIRKTNPYRSSASMPLIFLPCSLLHRPSFESIVKLLATLAGIIWHSIEVNQELSRHHVMTNPSHEHALNSTMNMSMILAHRTKHHVAIYLGFFLGSIVELMIHAGIQLPKKLGNTYFLFNSLFLFSILFEFFFLLICLNLFWFIFVLF